MVVLPKTNDFESESRRPLTFAERRVNLSGIKATMNKKGEELDTSLLLLKEKILAGELTEDEIKKEVLKIVTPIQKHCFEFWKQTASSELELKVNPTHKNLEGLLLAQNKAMVDRMFEDIKGRYEKEGLSRSFTDSVQFSEGGIFSRFFNGLKSFFVLNAINLWRESVFKTVEEDIHAYQYSAIIDDRTTALCRSLDGMLVKPWSAEYERFKPPNHWNCRSLWIAIMKEDPRKPYISWKPYQLENLEEKSLKLLWSRREAQAKTTS